MSKCKHWLLLAAALLVASTSGVAAQSFPSRPITLIVPFAAGGGTDAYARILAERMRQSLGQSILVENVGGAGGTIAAGRVARAPPDGHVIFAGHWGTMVANGATYDLAFDLRTAFEPISRTAISPSVIVGKRTTPANDLTELIAWLKANPDKASQGTSGSGTSSHVWGVFLQQLTGVRYQFVPYRGIAPAMQDLIAGQIDMMITSTTDSLPQVRAGTIKAYAVTTGKRLAIAPDIPTVDEAGLPGFRTQMWHGIWAPARTPKDIVARLNAAVVDALTDPEIRRRFGAARAGYSPARGAHPRGTRRIPPGRDREVVADHPGRGRAGAMTRITPPSPWRPGSPCAISARRP